MFYLISEVDKEVNSTFNANLANFTDEDRAAIAIRCLAGEDENKVAREVGVSPRVIEAWMNKVAQGVGKKEITQTQQEEDKEVGSQIASLQKTAQELQKRIAEMHQFAEVREVTLKSHSVKPIFAK